MGKYIDIITRAEWGARYGEGWGTRPLPATEVWVHHTETNQLSENASLEDDMVEIRYIDYIGYTRFKYADEGYKRPEGAGISYTWLITPSGRVFEGHAVQRRSSHTGGHNTAGVGIALVGNFETRRPTDKQIESLARLLLEAKENGHIAESRITGGHWDTQPTSCPGKEGYKAIALANNRANEILNPPYNWKDDTEYVRWVQDSLKTLGFYKDTVDGIAGTNTVNAVVSFQISVGLDPDGIPGDITKSAIIEALADKEIDDRINLVAELRIAGNRRWATAQAVTEAVFPAGRGLLIAADESTDFQMAVTRADENVRVLPVPREKSTAPVEILRAAKNLKPEWVRVVGGPNAVYDECVLQILEITGLI